MNRTLPVDRLRRYFLMGTPSLSEEAIACAHEERAFAGSLVLAGGSEPKRVAEVMRIYHRARVRLEAAEDRRRKRRGRRG